LGFERLVIADGGSPHHRYSRVGGGALHMTDLIYLAFIYLDVSLVGC
jgi:hypothetical protein